MNPTTFALIFLMTLTLNSMLRFYLAQRQIKHIQKYQNHVPEQFSQLISLEDHQHAGEYSVAKQKLARISILLDVLVILGLTFGGGLNALDSLAHHWFSNELGYGTFLMLSVLFVTGLIEFPLNLYATFGIESRFGFNRTTKALFLKDTLIQLSVGLILGVPLMMLILTLMNHAGNLWWLYTWIVWVAFNLMILTIYPNFIAPLFNQFKPLEHLELKQRIEQLLQKCGFQSEGLFVMDGSTRSSHGNAYFSGLGKSKRIVFFDTLLETLSPSQIEAVLAHELGHFKHKHVIKRMIGLFSMSLICLYGLNYLMQTQWFYLGLNINSQSTAMSLVIFMMILPVFLFMLQPLSSFYSRKHEFEADNYASQQTNPQDLIDALMKLYKDNASTLTPDPLYSAVYDSHPKAFERIENLKNNQRKI